MIKVGYCIAYDWYLLENSLPNIYNDADLIVLSIDVNRTTWAGNKFEFDDNKFEKLIQKIDIHNKIKIYEDDFYVKELMPMQNEVKQRNKIADFMGQGGWHLQLDSDEYFIDFKGFVSYLKKLNTNKSINVCCPWVTMYKSIDNGYLIIDNSDSSKIEFVPIATNKPKYEYGRKNGYFNIITNFQIIHQSWARTAAEIKDKINNWGHKEDFDTQQYYNKWLKLDHDNYLTYKNFHPIVGSNWEKLILIPAKSIKELMMIVKNNPLFKISKISIYFSNSIWISRLKKITKSICKSPLS